MERITLHVNNILCDITYSPEQSLSRESLISCKVSSARNPNFPKCTPIKGICLSYSFLLAERIVPSPPKTKTRSAVTFISASSSEILITERCDFLRNRGSSLVIVSLIFFFAYIAQEYDFFHIKLEAFLYSTFFLIPV